jgi:predicted Fe-Mo cluster-binding NifX family protein
MRFEVFDNESGTLGGGAGIQAAQFVASKGAQVVITGNCGPNAVRTLSAAGVELVVGQAGVARQAIEDYKAGKMKSTTEPNVAEHYGMGAAVETEPVYQGAPGGGGRGLGCGRGMGRGMGMRGGTTPPQDLSGRARASAEIGQEKDLEALKDQAREMRGQMESIELRIRNLEERVKK